MGSESLDYVPLVSPDDNQYSTRKTRHARSKLHEKIYLSRNQRLLGHLCGSTTVIFACSRGPGERGESIYRRARRKDDISRFRRRSRQSLGRSLQPYTAEDPKKPSQGVTRMSK